MAGTLSSSPQRLGRLATHHAALRPDAIALRFEGGESSYAMLAERVEGVARVLRDRWQLRAGERVAWLGMNHPDQIVLLFALARLGAALLPLNFRLAPAEWAQQLADCGPSHLVHDAAWGAQAAELASRCGLALHSLAEFDAASASASASASAAVPDAGGDDSAVLLVYTSGTTGAPRAAVHTQANLLANMRIAASVQEMTPQDRVLTVLPMFHVGGLCIQTLPALHAGACVTLHARFSPDATLAAIAAERPTLTLQVPPTMKALVDHPHWPATDLSSLRAVWAGSSLLPADLVRAFLDRGVPLCDVYGSTETGPFSIALPAAFAASHAGGCGWPAPEVEARLVDVQGGAGELLLRGPNVVRRYWPEQPACDADGWFHTGDLATRAADGSYTIVGRAKDLIISGGENIHPLEIEAAVATHAAVAECAAYAVPDAQWGEAVALAVVLQPGAQLTAEALRRHLEGRLARFKWPRRIVSVPALPKTALGKLQRSALAAMTGRLLPNQ
jgi:fatty-acyl-CoA synthase